MSFIEMQDRLLRLPPLLLGFAWPACFSGSLCARTAPARIFRRATTADFGGQRIWRFRPSRLTAGLAQSASQQSGRRLAPAGPSIQTLVAPLPLPAAPPAPVVTPVTTSAVVLSLYDRRSCVGCRADRLAVRWSRLRGRHADEAKSYGQHRCD